MLKRDIAEWAVGLEEILKKAVDKGLINEDSTDEIQRSKFWRDLYGQDLKNAIKINYESEVSFEKLSLEVQSKIRFENIRSR